MATEESKDWYRFTGMKNEWDETSVIVLEGSSTNPKVAVEKGRETELTESQVEVVKNMGGRLSKVSDEKVKALEEERSGDAPPQRGSQQTATAQSGSTPPPVGGKKN